MSFTVPPLPGEELLSIPEAARRLNCSGETIRTKIRLGLLAAVNIAGHRFIAEGELKRFEAAWPLATRGPSARWRQYRAWKAAQRGQRSEVAA